MNKRAFVNALVLLALITVIVYIVTRAVLLDYAGYTGIEKVTVVMLFVAELFIIMHGVGYTLNIYTAYKHRQAGADLYARSRRTVDSEPEVAVLVAVRHEPQELLRETFTSIKSMEYCNMEIFLLDDSSLERYKREADELALELGLRLFRREPRHGAKAGIINDLLKTLHHKYVVLFDADQNPMPEFLNRLVPIMEEDPRLAFVQTPQFYTNIEDSPVARAAAFQLAVFYEYICEGKSSREAMFCCGTNIIFRREALSEVGGLDEATVTEDFATSLKLHSRKWRSLYYGHVNAFGLAPRGLGEYFKQQYRWANGTITVFKRGIWSLIRHPFSLRPGQWWEYFLSGSYYLVGLAFLILMMFPVGYLIFDIPSFFVRPEIYLLTFLPYVMLSFSIFYSVLRGRNYRVKDLFLGQLLSGITFPVYIRAAFTALLGRKTQFAITSKSGMPVVPYRHLWPQISLFFLNFGAMVWGVNRFVYERQPAIIVNAFWAGFHLLILASVFHFNRSPGITSCKVVKKGLSFDYKVVSSGAAEEGPLLREWGLHFMVPLPEHLSKGALVMCKMTDKTGNTAVFDARVLMEGVRAFKGYRTCLGVVTVSGKDRERLEKEFLR